MAKKRDSVGRSPVTMDFILNGKRVPTDKDGTFTLDGGDVITISRGKGVIQIDGVKGYGTIYGKGRVDIMQSGVNGASRNSVVASGGAIVLTAGSAPGARICTSFEELMEFMQPGRGGEQ